MSDKYDGIKTNKSLAALFGLPEGTTEAILHMKVGEIPMLTITKLAITDHMVTETLTQKYRLVLIEDDAMAGDA